MFLCGFVTMSDSFPILFSCLTHWLCKMTDKCSFKFNAWTLTQTDSLTTLSYHNRGTRSPKTYLWFIVTTNSLRETTKYTCTSSVLKQPHTQTRSLRAISVTSPLNWLQPHSRHFAHFPHPSLVFDGPSVTLGQQNTGELGQNNATIPTAAPLSGWTIPNDQSQGGNNTGTGNRYRPTSSPEFKFRNSSTQFCIVLSKAQSAQIKDWVLERDIVMDGKPCVGIVCKLSETKGELACTRSYALYTHTHIKYTH